MNIYSFDGLLVFALLMICTCAYLSRIPRLKSMLLSEKKGTLGFYCTSKKKKGRASGWTYSLLRASKVVYFSVFHLVPGFAGIFYKFSVIGTRLHIPVAISCAVMAFYIVFLR